MNDYVLKDQSYKPFYENQIKSRNKIVNTPLTNKSFQNPMGSSEYLPVETHHRRENNIELHKTEQEKTLTNIDSGFQEHNTKTMQMPHTPGLAQRRLTSTPLYPNDRNGNNFDELSYIPTTSSHNLQNGQTSVQTGSTNERIQRHRRQPSFYQAGFN